jgi:hypothetical protein
MADLTKIWASWWTILKINHFDSMHNLTFGQNCHFNIKKPCFFMPHAFNQNKHPFGQCGHFSQVEPFEKPWFVVVKLQNIVDFFLF